MEDLKNQITKNLYEFFGGTAGYELSDLAFEAHPYLKTFYGMLAEAALQNVTPPDGASAWNSGYDTGVSDVEDLIRSFQPNAQFHEPCYGEALDDVLNTIQKLREGKDEPQVKVFKVSSIEDLEKLIQGLTGEQAQG